MRKILFTLIIALIVGLFVAMNQAGAQSAPTVSSDVVKDLRDLPDSGDSGHDSGNQDWVVGEEMCALPL